MPYHSAQHPFPPIYDEHSRILILGSFPSVKTRQMGFYYGHRQNRFWPLMSALLSIHPTLAATDPPRAESALLTHHIALWSSIASCDIIGSSDSSIRNAVPTDLAPIFSGAQIRHVFCNGGASFRYYKKYQTDRPDIPVMQLPSTSPANARWSLDNLIDAWQVILPYLKEDWE